MECISENTSVPRRWIVNRDSERCSIGEAFCLECPAVEGCAYRTAGREFECMTLRRNLMECATECLALVEQLNRSSYDDRCLTVWKRYSEIGRLVGRIPQRAALMECGVNPDGWSNKRVHEEFKRVFGRWIADEPG